MNSTELAVNHGYFLWYTYQSEGVRAVLGHLIKSNMASLQYGIEGSLDFVGFTPQDAQQDELPAERLEIIAKSIRDQSKITANRVLAVKSYFKIHGANEEHAAATQAAEDKYRGSIIAIRKAVDYPVELRKLARKISSDEMRTRRIHGILSI